MKILTYLILFLDITENLRVRRDAARLQSGPDILKQVHNCISWKWWFHEVHLSNECTWKNRAGNLNPKRINPPIYGQESEFLICKAMDCGFVLLIFYSFLFCWMIQPSKTFKQKLLKVKFKMWKILFLFKYFFVYKRPLK